MSDWTQTAHWVVAWGPGLVILLGIYRLVSKPPEFVGLFIAAQQAQAVAMAKMADAVQEVTARSSKLDELLVNDQVILRRSEEILRRLDGGAHVGDSAPLA